jgi:hypothetical protein
MRVLTDILLEYFGAGNRERRLRRSPHATFIFRHGFAPPAAIR